MKRLYTIAVLSLALCACAGNVPPPSSIPTSPVELADRTKVDEKAIIGLETAYKTFRTAVEAGVDAKLIEGNTALKLQRINRDVYGYLGVARNAYATGNAASFWEAIDKGNAMLNAGNYWLGN